MKTGRFLFLVLLALSCWLSARAFQISIPNGIPSSSAREGTQAGQDELTTHRSAADTYQLSGDFEHARIENRLIISIALRRLATIAVKEGQLKRSAEILTESINANDSVEARTGLALVYMQLGDIEAGIKHAQAAVNLDGNNGDAQEALGKLSYIKGDYAAAVTPLERVLELKPNFDAAYALGTTYLQLKEIGRAKLLFEEILGGVTNKAALHVLFGKAYEGTNYPVEAEREFRKAIAVDPKMPRAHFYLAYLILQDGGSERLAEAGKEFELELALSPKDPYSNFFAGVVSSSDNDHRTAIRYLQETVRLDPNMGTAYLFLGQSQAELGENASAERNLRKAIELATDPSKNSFEIRRAHFLLGRLLIKLGRKDEGEKELANARVLQGQLLESARDEIRKILGQVVISTNNAYSSNSFSSKEIAGKPSIAAQESARLQTIKNQLIEIVAQAYHNLGVVAMQEGQTDESLAKFDAASKWKPDFRGLDRNWGIVAFRAGQFEKAIPPLSRHVKASPKDPLTRRMLGVSYYFSRKYKAAAETLKPIELSIVDDPELAYFYGVCLFQLQRRQEAGAAFARLADQNQKSAQAQFYAGQGFVLTGDYERAVREFRTAAALDPQMPKAHYNAGQSLIRLNRLADAEKEFRQELQLNPSDETSKYHLAYSLLERKAGTEEALSLLREAIAIRYDYADARYQLGKALIEKGEIKEAMEQLETAVNIEPKKDYIHYQLSIAYRRATRLSDADRELKLYQELKSASRSGVPRGMETTKNEP